MPRWTDAWLRMIAALGLSLLAAASIEAQQLPMAKLVSLSPAGGKVGSEFELKISGGELDNVDRLMFSHPGITATLKMEPAGDFSRQPRPAANTFLVMIAGDVPQGLHEVRAIGYFGMTNPRAFQVGALDEVADAGGNNEREKAQELKVGSVVSGQGDNDAVDYYKITAAAGQRMLIDCFAQRLDSRMEAALVLYDASGRELRRAAGSDGRDPVLELNAASAGDYILGVYDFTYVGGPERFYRLALHSGPHIDFVFPPVGQAGATSKFTLYGRNLPGGKPVDAMKVDGSTLEQLEVDIALPGDAAARQKLTPAGIVKPFEATVDALAWQLSAPQGASNPIAIGYATAPLVVEAEANDDAAKPQLVNVPCEFVGQFYPRGDSDWVQFTAQQGDVFWLEVVSQRMGLPTDPVIVVERIEQNDKGETTVKQMLATDDDIAERQRDNQPQMFSINNRDPHVRFEAGEAGNYRVGVRDLYGDSRGDPRMVYRLAIRQAQPDFQVLVFSGVTPAENNNQIELGGLALRRGQAAKLTVAIDRRDGFDGEVQIVAEGLPPGVTCGGALVGGKANDAVLILQAAADAPAAAATFRIIGRAKIGEQDVTRDARHGALTWGTTNPQQEPPIARITRDIAISVSDKETAPASAQAGAAVPIETSLGATIKLPIKVARHNGFAASLKFRAEDVPQNVQAKEVDVAGADGEMEIALNRNDIQPGTYTFNLSGQTKIKYTQNPEALKAAEDRFKELDEIFKEFTDKAKQAGDAARAAQEQADQKKDEQALANAAMAADENAKALEEKRKQAENMRREFEQKLNQTRESSKERDVNYWVISSPVTLRIAPTPITVAAAPAAKKQGEKFQLLVTVERKYGFDDVIELTLEAPGGVDGVSVPQLKVEKGKNQGTLEITFNDNATAGTHNFTLRGRVRYNNIQLDQTLPLALTIEPK